MFVFCIQMKTKRGKKSIFGRFMDYLFPSSVCECVCACKGARAWYSINNWLNFPAYFWTRGCACIQTPKEMCCIYDLERGHFFYPSTSMFSPCQSHSSWTSRALCVRVCVVYMLCACMGLVCHTECIHSSFFSFVCPLVCLFAWCVRSVVLYKSCYAR